MSERERECLYLATRFMRPKEIALRLGCAPKTVEGHFRRIVDKLGVESIRHAAALYSDHLSGNLSGNTLAGISRLSDSLASSAPASVDDDAEPDAATLREGETQALDARRSDRWPFTLVERWKGADPDDLTIPLILRAVVIGAIILAVVFATVINLVTALDEFASTATRP